MIKTILLCSLVINLIFLSTNLFAQSDEVKAQMAERVEKALVLFESPDWNLKKAETAKEVQTLLEQNLKEVPEDSETLRVYAVILRDLAYISDDNYELSLMHKALEIIHRSINSNPKNQSAMIEKINILIAMKNPEAKNFLYSTYKDFDKSKMLYRQARKLASSFYNLKDKENGDVYFDLALKLATTNKDKASVHVIKADFWDETEKYDLCIEAYKLAISLDDKEAFSYGNLSNCYYKKNMFDEAIDYAKKALSIINYGNARITVYLAYKQKASQFEIKNDYKKAEENYLQALKYYNYFEGYLAITELYLKMKDINKAKETAKLATKYPDAGITPTVIDNRAKLIFAKYKITYP